MKEKIPKKKIFTIYIGTYFVLFMIITGAVFKLNLNENVRIITAKDEKTAGELLDKGCTLYENGEYEKSIEIWEGVYNYYRGTISWGKAAYNIGLAYMCLEKYTKAIPYFLEILESDVDDLEPGQSVMEAYRNYRHRSCLQISHCYENLENYEKALEYAILARDKYPYESWCGTCFESAYQSLEYDIRRLTVFKDWNNNKDLTHKFKLTYEIKAKPTTEYEVYLPFPIAKDNSNTHFINNIQIRSGNPVFKSIKTIYGNALNLSCKGECIIIISYSLTLNDDISEDKLVEEFSPINEEESDYYSYWKYYNYWVYCSFKDNNIQNSITLSLDSNWIKYKPNWEYNTWEIQETKLEQGWNSIYADVNCIPKDFEEPDPRPTGGSCLEFDYERNIILIGTDDGFGMYYTENETYKLFGSKNGYNPIFSIAIDYNHDTYYLGTLEGIIIYDIKNNTYNENPNDYSAFQNIRKIAYNSYNDMVLTYEYPNLRNIPFYDSKNNILFIFDENRLGVIDYKNNITKSLKITDEVIDGYPIRNIDFAYDSKLNIIFLSLEYESYSSYAEVNWSVIGYNINNNEVLYINLPKFQSFTRVWDLSLNPKQHLLYIASGNGLYEYNISKNELNRIDWKFNLDWDDFGSLTFDLKKDLLYFTYPSDEPNTLYKYDPKSGKSNQVK